MFAKLQLGEQDKNRYPQVAIQKASHVRAAEDIRVEGLYHSPRSKKILRRLRHIAQLQIEGLEMIGYDWIGMARSVLKNHVD